MILYEFTQKNEETTPWNKICIYTWRVFCLWFVPGLQGADIYECVCHRKHHQFWRKRHSTFKNCHYIYIYLVLSFLPTESTEQPIRTGPTKGGFILPAMTCFKNNINLLHLLDCFWLMFLLHYIASRTNLDPPCAKVIGHILGPNL